VGWEVEYTDEFGKWWDGLTEAAQKSVAKGVVLLTEVGPALGYPHSSDIVQSNISKMRELRIQHKGRPYRVLYAFDPTRTAILLLGGDKTGDDRWYQTNVPLAEKLYERYIQERKESDDGQKIH
jgi:hypothetical protein